MAALLLPEYLPPGPGGANLLHSDSFWFLLLASSAIYGRDDELEKVTRSAPEERKSGGVLGLGIFPVELSGPRKWMGGGFSYLMLAFLFFLKYLLFVYLHWVLVAACGSSLVAHGNLSSLVGSEPGRLALGAQSLSQWPTREVPSAWFSEEEMGLRSAGWAWRALRRGNLPCPLFPPHPQRSLGERFQPKAWPSQAFSWQDPSWPRWLSCVGQGALGRIPGTRRFQAGTSRTVRTLLASSHLLLGQRLRWELWA